ncbi:unnamed protein product [Periconia digitata]|uniref:Uncharacterized protein n=1 Tax=Periconia digitata TaxID=1303443 RepID=A0A9W4USD7_9PLEO|nr:unnamed protein product [Periconia digitata]
MTIQQHDVHKRPTQQGSRRPSPAPLFPRLPALPSTDRRKPTFPSRLRTEMDSRRSVTPNSLSTHPHDSTCDKHKLSPPAHGVSLRVVLLFETWTTFLFDALYPNDVLEELCAIGLPVAEMAMCLSVDNELH